MSVLNKQTIILIIDITNSYSRILSYFSWERRWSLESTFATDNLNNMNKKYYSVLLFSDQFPAESSAAPGGSLF